MGPAILGNAAVQINVLVNTNFASSITDAAGHVINGPVSWLSYAFRFMQLPLGLFGVAIASATLPAISRSAALQQMDEFRLTLARSLGMVLLLTIPSSVGLAVLGHSMIGAVYQWGKFRAADTHQTALALSCYAVGLAGYSAIKILAPAFYALNDARTPMLVSLVSILINLAAASTMVKLAGLGHLGLALSTSAVALFGSVVLFMVLRKRLHGMHGRALAASVAKILAASAAMARRAPGIWAPGTAGQAGRGDHGDGHGRIRAAGRHSRCRPDGRGLRRDGEPGGQRAAWRCGRDAAACPGRCRAARLPRQPAGAGAAAGTHDHLWLRGP